METTLELNEFQWQLAHAIALDLVKKETDVNELSKAIAYLRAYVNQDKAGEKFFAYLNALAKYSDKVARSKQTPIYYQNIQTTCKKYLESYQNNPPVMLQILGWVTRLMRYYKTVTIGEISIEEVAPIASSVKTELQAEIAKQVAKADFSVGQVVEAIVTTIKGNKVTYKILGKIPHAQKEPKKAQLLTEGQTVQVKIAELKEKGGIKKVILME